LDTKNKKHLVVCNFKKAASNNKIQKMQNTFFIKNESMNDSMLYKRPGKLIRC